MQPEIETAVRDVLAGKIDEFAVIVRAYQEELWRIAAWAMRDVEATEDLVQQAFVDAYLNLKVYEPGREFGAWIRAIARNRVRKELRAQARGAKRLRFYHDRIADHLETDTDEDASRHERLHSALAKCREKLTGDAAEGIAMRYERSLGFDTIAEALGRTVVAARQLLARVRLTLRNCIEERMSHS